MAGAAGVALAHNHPNGSLVPSPDDLTTTAVVADAFQKIHVEFLEHLLIAGDKFEPLLSKMEGAFWQKGKTAAFYGK